MWYNTNEYHLAPGVIVGCGFMGQKKLAEEILADAVAGKIRYGSSRTVGVKDGYLDFIDDDPDYLASLPLDIREKFGAFMNDVRAGRIAYTVPPLR